MKGLSDRFRSSKKKKNELQGDPIVVDREIHTIQRWQCQERRKRQGERYVAEGCRFAQKIRHLFLSGLVLASRTLTLTRAPITISIVIPGTRLQCAVVGAEIVVFVATNETCYPSLMLCRAAAIDTFASLVSKMYVFQLPNDQV